MARSRTFPVLAAFAYLMCAHFGYAGGAPVAGITVARDVPSAAEALRDVQARQAFREAVLPSKDRVIPFRKILRKAESGPISPSLSLTLSPAAPLPLAPLSLAPALDLSFAGIGNPTALGTDVIPPDTMGAVGPNHLVSLLNSDFGVFSKTTGLIPGTVVTLQEFWGSLGTAANQPANNPFDPKVLFDSNSGRFVAATIGGHVITPSWILVAMTATSDPTGTWYKVAIRADVDADNVVRNFGADYTCLGVDAANIYVAANMFDSNSNFQYSKVWVIPKSQPPLNGGTGSLTWTEFRNPAGLNRDGINAFAMQPAQTFGAAAAEYFIFEDGNNFLRMGSITTTISGTPIWNNLGSIQVAAFASLNATPDAPQLGNATGINTSDTRLLKAVSRNGSVWTTHHVSGAGGKTEVAWYQVNPATVSVVQQGRVSDPNRWYYYPSIAVNQNSDVAVGFSGSSSAEFVGGWYTARRNGDPSGTMQPPSLLKAGEASYLKTLGGTENRWGDFSATDVDPADDLSFWTLQEYAESQAIVGGNLRSMWGTWWGKFRPPAIAAPSLTATVVSTTQVDLGWTLPAGATGFIVERRLSPGGDFGAITGVLGGTVASYTDNTGTGGTSYSYRIHALSAGGDSYSNEAVANTPSPAAPTGGGGGGGCSVSRGNGPVDPISAGVLLFALFLPVYALAARRRISRRRSGAAESPPPARPGGP